VKVYFSKHPESDQHATAVFAVRRISPTRAVATFAIGQLLVGPTQAEANAAASFRLTWEREKHHRAMLQQALEEIRARATR